MKLKQLWICSRGLCHSTKSVCFVNSHFYSDWVTLIISGIKGCINIQAVFADPLDCAH